jgi:hypothetical protein
MFNMDLSSQLRALENYAQNVRTLKGLPANLQDEIVRIANGIDAQVKSIEVAIGCDEEDDDDDFDSSLDDDDYDDDDYDDFDDDEFCDSDLE